MKRGKACSKEAYSNFQAIRDMRGRVRTAQENLDDATALIDHELRFKNYVTVAHERNKRQESVVYLVYVSMTHGISSRKKDSELLKIDRYRLDGWIASCSEPRSPETKTDLSHTPF